MSYHDKIQEQLKDFETPKDFSVMGDSDLINYHEKMETVGCMVNTYGPDRCAKYRKLAESAFTEIKNRDLDA